jgi:hypothetical protein
MLVAMLATCAGVWVASNLAAPPSSGPLTSGDNPWNMGLDPATPTNAWTLGVSLCVSDARSDAVIDSITPTDLVGQAKFLGAKVRQFTPSASDRPIVGVSGYPPDVPDALLDPAGVIVSGGCSANARQSHYTEVLLGIGREGSGGGGWRAEEIAYHVGSTKYSATLAFGMVICGPQVPAQYCAPGDPAPSALTQSIPTLLMESH